MAPSLLRNCPAPAKLNLFLHVTGRRPDGYHLLQTLFQLVDRADYLHVSTRSDGVIRRTSSLSGVPEDEDLVVRAARLLQSATGAATHGADIAVDKRLPMGGGLGGGSSDAATTLIVLNHLWQTGLDRPQLMALGLQLGADVPFFLYGRSAFAEGIGESLVPVATPDCWYVVIEPGVVVPTAAIFAAQELTRNTKPVTIADFSSSPIGFGKNDLQDVAASRFSQVSDALDWLAKHAAARMTGSGACVFCMVQAEAEADEILAQLPHKWTGWKARSLQRHPLADLLPD